MNQQTRGVFVLLAALVGAMVGESISSVGIFSGAEIGFLLAIIAIGLCTK